MSVGNKVAIVTGAASGIGRASARLLAREGAKVVVADRDADAGERVRQDIERSAGAALAVGFDIGDSAQCKALVDRTLTSFGRVDVLVHAAGVCPRVPLLEMTDAQWRDVLRINLDGTFYLTRDVARAMVAQRSGTMILLTSDRGLHGSIDYAHYAASKGGMIALVKSLALALGKSGVTVNGVNPGMTDTPLARGANPASWDAKVAVDVLGKASQPDEIAQTILFLAGRGGAYTTGQIIGTRLRHGQ
jgi:NAD(P)-dependent dehydrogenase (short-subunit alcohol dehydrogenase family)